MTQEKSCGYSFHSGMELVYLGRRPSEILESFRDNIAERASDYKVLQQKFRSSQGGQILEFQQIKYGSFLELTKMTGITDGNNHTGIFQKLFSYKCS